jgi:Fe2+ or Zn2+ uptake regulation protein
MVKDGELKKLKVLGSKWVYETNIWNHAHLIDNKTGKIKDIEIDKLNTSFIPKDFCTKNIELNIYWEFER